MTPLLTRLLRRGRGGKAAAVETSLAAFETCLLELDGDRVTLVAGEEAFAAFAAAPFQMQPTPPRWWSAWRSRIPALPSGCRRCGYAERPSPLRSPTRGCGWTAAPPAASPCCECPGWPAAPRRRPVRNGSPPSWTAGQNRRGSPTPPAPVWANRAWLTGVGAESLEIAKARGLSLDGEADRMVREAAATREARAALRWVRLAGARRALRFRALPMEGALVGVWSDDVTEAETAAEKLGGLESAQEAILGQIADAVAVFGADRRLTFHNPAFARLWDLEPAWLADRPAHAELLDRLRQRGRLPEQGDYNRFKADELARHEGLTASAETIWRLPDQRSLKVVSQPHPRGGLMMVFSDVTPELRLRSQFNHLLQVQQATLDKLSDAVAVFGADGRLRLHNEAFEHFWSASSRPARPPAWLSTTSWSWPCAGCTICSSGAT